MIVLGPVLSPVASSRSALQYVVIASAPAMSSVSGASGVPAGMTLPPLFLPAPAPLNVGPQDRRAAKRQHFEMDLDVSDGLQACLTVSNYSYRVCSYSYRLVVYYLGVLTEESPAPGCS